MKLEIVHQHEREIDYFKENKRKNKRKRVSTKEKVEPKAQEPK